MSRRDHEDRSAPEVIPTISGSITAPTEALHLSLSRSVSRASTESTDLPSADPTALHTPEPETQLEADQEDAIRKTLAAKLTTNVPKLFESADAHIELSKPISPEPAIRKQGSLVTIFAIWNTMMGATLLIMPWAIAQAGFILGIFLTIFLGCLSYYTCSLVLSSAERQKDANDAEKVMRPAFFDFGDAIEYYLGRRLALCGVVISLLTFLGALIAYWIFMSRFLFNVGNVIYHYAWDTNSTEADARSKLEAPIDFEALNVSAAVKSFKDFWSAQYTVPVYLAAILLPLSCMREPTVFTKFNALGVCSVFVLLAYVIYRAVIWGINMDSGVDDSIRGFNTKFPAITGSLSMGFFIHNGILPITQHHEKPQNKKRDLGLAYLLVALTYLSIGIIFYITYPERKDEIPDNFLRLVTKVDIFGIVASVFLLFQMVTVYPLMLYMFRNQFLVKILKKIDYRYGWIIAVNAVVVTICILLAMFWPRVGTLIRIVGAISGFAYNYTFPCLVYLAMLRAAGYLTKLSLFLHAIIIIFGVLNLIGQFIIPVD
ncbi:sodium-coupled neutral amino acid transporter 9 homolog [Paramacrobiotus metropolitanus]|uniref:sodium-coupled neutral amino acid transporter 9 homolog n=1 Tax=Paramacrobiotus metropolitanus TaxID=2943436 RepID=UPI002445D4A9|nr:sodium-coupled neutral amino acid transporter 9 homolog [Paramacrobiotus metropolitanus]